LIFFLEFNLHLKCTRTCWVSHWNKTVSALLRKQQKRESISHFSP